MALGSPRAAHPYSMSAEKSWLGMLGINNGGAGPPPWMPDKPPTPVKPDPAGMALPTMLNLGARFPFVAFVATLTSFTYMYHISPVMPWMLVFLSLTFGIIVCWPPKSIGERRRGFWDWAPMCSWFIAVGCAIGFGLLNYGILESWINTAYLREYKDVSPVVQPLAVVDAGVLSFTQGTHLDTASAAGFKFWFYNYCAAPVVNADAKAAPVTFWAVGVGCCGSRGEFTCDSAGDKSAHSAMPLRPYNIGPEITSHYNTAISMAAAANGLEVNKEAVFVVWQKDPKASGNSAWWISTAIVVLLIVAAFGSCMGAQTGLKHIYDMQQ